MEQIKINSTLFGTLEFPSNEGLYQEYQLTLDNEEITTTLNIFEDFINESNTPIVENLLNKLPNMYTFARQEIQNNYKTLDLIQDFIRYHLEEIDEDSLKELFSVAELDEITDEMFIHKLRLNTVFLCEVVRGIECTLDFMLDPDYSDEILVFNFNKEGEFINISHES